MSGKPRPERMVAKNRANFTHSLRLL